MPNQHRRAQAHQPSCSQRREVLPHRPFVSRATGDIRVAEGSHDLPRFDFQVAKSDNIDLPFVVGRAARFSRPRGLGLGLREYRSRHSRHRGGGSTRDKQISAT